MHAERMLLRNSFLGRHCGDAPRRRYSVAYFRSYCAICWFQKLSAYYGVCGAMQVRSMPSCLGQHTRRISQPLLRHDADILFAWRGGQAQRLETRMRPSGRWWPALAGTNQGFLAAVCVLAANCTGCCNLVGDWFQVLQLLSVLSCVTTQMFSSRGALYRPRQRTCRNLYYYMLLWKLYGAHKRRIVCWFTVQLSIQPYVLTILHWKHTKQGLAHQCWAAANIVVRW